MAGEDGNTYTKPVRIHEIHMEEDAGKLVHDDWEDCTLVDYNRSGVPLIEIVSEPDMRSAEEVIAYLEKLRLLIQYLGASDCKLQEGSMRADVNLSVREVGAEKFGTRTEMKNLNSFKAIARAIQGERSDRSICWRPAKRSFRRPDAGMTTRNIPMRCVPRRMHRTIVIFPDPDLVPVYISDEWLESIRSKQPEFRTEKMKRYKEEYDIPEYDIDIITGSKHLADIFEASVALGSQPKKVSNWLMVETMRLLKEKEMEPEDIRFSPEHLSGLITLVDGKVINSSVAKEVFQVMFEEDVDPEQYVEEKGLKTVNDEGALRKVVEEVIAANPQSVEDYHNGKKESHRLPGRSDHEGNERQGRSRQRQSDAEGTAVN